MANMAGSSSRRADQELPAIVAGSIGGACAAVCSYPVCARVSVAVVPCALLHACTACCLKEAVARRVLLL